MKTSRIAPVIILLIALLGMPTLTHAQLPFGGKIATFAPVCVAPPATLLSIGPPTPMFLMYQPGITISKLFGPPTHPGQWLTGNYGVGAIPCMVPCGPILCPIGAGAPIIIHGSSM